MSVCKADPAVPSKERNQIPSGNEKGKTDPVGKYFKGYSSMVFLRRGKHKRRPSRSNPSNISKEIQESERKSLNVATKKCEVLGFEEVSNEFTCDSSLMETYHLNTTKEARFSFRKLDDGTFVLESKPPNESEKTESGLIKRSSKKRQKKGRSSHKPLKICFKKRSKALRKSSNDDGKLQSSALPCLTEQETVTSVATSQEENSLEIQSTGTTWANFKRLVTPRHPETNTSDTAIEKVSQKKRFSNLKFPCMKFSRAKRSSNTSEEPPCAVQSSENCTESGSDYGRSDNALATKYKLQKSLEIENGKIDICTEQCPTSKHTMEQGDGNEGEDSPPDKQSVGQDISSSEKRKSRSPVKGHPMCESLKASTDLQSARVPNGPLVNDDTSSEKTNHVADDQNEDTNSQSGSEDEPSLGAILDPNSDIYEFLLMRTAASLVSRVIQSSIHQIVEEKTLLNHGPCKASHYYV